MTLPWKNPGLTLGERCVLWSLDQMETENPPGRERVASYFAPCMRHGSDSLGEWLASEVRGGKKHNHCAAAASKAALECALPDDDIPHRPRAGAKELMRDAIEAGRWHSATEARSDLWLPGIGDLAIYDRSKPGRPETSWWGHVDRVKTVTEEGYENIGANEGPRGEWTLHFTRFDHPRLLGFVSYPSSGPENAFSTFTPEELRHYQAVRDQSIADVIAEAPWEKFR